MNKIRYSVIWLLMLSFCVMGCFTMRNIERLGVSEARAVLFSDSIIAVGKSQNNSAAAQLLLLIGKEHTYALTEGADAIMGVATQLDGSKIVGYTDHTAQLKLEVTGKNAQGYDMFSGLARVSYNKPIAQLTPEERSNLTQLGFEESDLNLFSGHPLLNERDEQGKAYTKIYAKKITLKGGVLPALPNQDGLQHQFNQPRSVVFYKSSRHIPIGQYAMLPVSVLLDVITLPVWILIVLIP